MPGALVTLEGIDQAGKQTQAERIREQLRGLGISCALRQYPEYGTPIGQLIEKSLREGLPIAARARVMLFAANRWECDAQIRALLQENDLVLIDRYGASNLVYGMAQGYDADWLANLEAGLASPDLTVFIDIPPQESRRRKSEDRDGFERDVALLTKARERYLEQAQRLNWVVVEGAQPPSQVTQQILRALRQRLASRFPAFAALRA